MELLFQSKQEKLGDGSILMVTKVIGVLDGTTVRNFEEKVLGFLTPKMKNLILVFSEIRYINSTGIGLLVKLVDKYHDKGAEIRLVGVSEKVLLLLETLGVAPAFKIYKTEEDAMAAVLGIQGSAQLELIPSASKPSPFAVSSLLASGGATDNPPSLASEKSNVERTLILIKPDAIQRGLSGEILTRFERKGLKIVGMKMLQMTDDMASTHYREHIGKKFYGGLAQFMTSQPIIAIALEGPGAVLVCREMTGATFGVEAKAGTIRGDYGVSNRFTLIHSSENREAAARELSIFFRENELFSYQRVLDGFIASEEDIRKAANLGK